MQPLFLRTSTAEAREAFSRMNITVVSPDGSLQCRPDTTWEREDRDFYVPDGVESLSFTPVLFARMSRAGRCIAPKFAARYYDSVCYGVLLSVDGCPWGHIFDRSSVLPAVTYTKLTLEKEDNAFVFSRNSETLFSAENGKDSASRLENAISRASETVSQRTGDLVALEIGDSMPLCSRKDDSAQISGSYCGNRLFDFKIIF